MLTIYPRTGNVDIHPDMIPDAAHEGLAKPPNLISRFRLGVKFRASLGASK